jgi:hypothetical protein
MAFLDSLRRALGSDPAASDRERRLRLLEAWGMDLAGGDAVDAGPADPGALAGPPDPAAYDRDLWRKKLRLLLNEKMPVPEREWADFLADAGALGLDRAWVEEAQRHEFEMLVRRAVADGVVTLEEHHKIDLARHLIGLSDAEAEATLRRVVDEARALFGRPVEGT